MKEAPKPFDLPLARLLPTLAAKKLLQRLRRDPVLLGAAVFCAALLSYQLAVMLVRPPWVGAATDWLRAALAWPALFIMLLASVTASRARRPEARAWWMLSTALFSYAVARTLWSILDQIFYPDHAPFPSFPDPFFMLQYPFYLLAIILIPSGRTWESRVKLVLDGLLIMGSIAALFWNFLLEPLYMQSHVSPQGRFVNLYYPTMDLAILFGLTIMFIYHQCKLGRGLVSLLIAAILCLVTADVWVAWLIATVGFTPGTPPDLFWIAFYVLLPLVGLVWLRHSRFVPVSQEAQQVPYNNLHLQREDLKDVLRLLFPFIAALLASTAIPGVFPPVSIGHRDYVDGGVANHTPLTVAKELGATTIYVLPVGYPWLNHEPTSALGMALHALARIVEQKLDAEVAANRALADIHVLPACDVADVSPADFSHTKELIEWGRRQARRYLTGAAAVKSNGAAVPEKAKKPLRLSPSPAQAA